MIPYEMWQVVRESEFNKLVTQTYGVPFSYQQLNMLGNDTVHYIDVKDMAAQRPFEIQEFEAWKAAKKPDDNDPKHRYWEMGMERGEVMSVPVSTIFADLAERKLIPEDGFHLYIWW